MKTLEKSCSPWRQTSLGEILPLKYGKARSVQFGYLRPQTSTFGSNGAFGTFDRALTEKPAIIVGRKGAAGAVHYSPEPCWPIDTAFYTEGANGVFLPFFRYLLDSLQLVQLDRSTAIPSLSRDDYDSKIIRYPESLSEQRRIVAEIEMLFTRLEAGVAALRRVQAGLKRYCASVLKAACEGKLVSTETELARKKAPKESSTPRNNASPDFESGTMLLQRILAERRAKWNGQGSYKEPAALDTTNLPPLPEGWTWCISDAVFSFVTSGSRGWAKYYSDEGPIFLRIGNLNHEDIRLDLGELQRVAPPVGAEGMRTVVQAGDILVSITADVGMVGLVPTALGEAYINQHIALARPLSSVCASYLAYYLCSSEGGWRYLKKRQRGATKVGLGLDDIRAVPVPLPPLAEQQRIVTEVERRLSVIEELEAVVSANLQRTARLRQAILRNAFQFGVADVSQHS